MALTVGDGVIPATAPRIPALSRNSRFLRSKAGIHRESSKAKVLRGFPLSRE
jgi:hypothetical protein